MKPTNIKSVMRKLVRQADMPMFEGMGGGGGSEDGSRVQWKKFSAGVANLVQGGPLPPEVAARLTTKIDDFRSEFEQFAMNDATGKALTKYAGMIFAYYAVDFIGNDAPDKVRALPDYLRETLAFVKDNNIVLPNLDQSGGKGIGSPYWMSHYGYAFAEYAKEKGQSVEKGQRTRAREIRKVPANVAENNGWPWGSYSIQETPNGAGIFIDTSNSSNAIGTVPVLDPSGNPKPRWRLFKGDLDPKSGASNVVIRGGPNGIDIEPAKRVNLGRMFEMEGRNVATNAVGDPIPKSHLNPAQVTRARSAYDLHLLREQAAAEGELYQMKLNEDGTIMLRNVAEADGWYPMSVPQLQSILKEGWNQSLPEVAIVPESSREGQGSTQGAMGKFTPSEGLMAELSAEDGTGYFRSGLEAPAGNGKNPHSFESLRELTAFLGQGKVSVNSYRLSVIGPVFSQAKNFGEGQAEITTPMMMSPETSADPMSNSLAVDRGIDWGLHMTNHAPGRMKGVGDRGGNAWKTEITDTIEEAFQLLQAEALKFDADADLSVIGADAARIAQNALGKTIEMPADAPALPQQPITQPGGNLPGPSNISNEPVDYDTTLGPRTSSIRNLMKRLSRK